MATKDFLLPDLGEGLTEGEVVSWLVSVGDVVEVDQYVAEIETAKAVVEVPSPYAGTIVTLHGEPGDEVQVGAPLVTIEVGGDDAPAADDAADDTSVEGTAHHEEPADAARAKAQQESGQAGDGESGSVLVGYGTAGGKGSRRRRVGAATAPGGSTPPPPSGPPQKVQREGRPLAKPPVRKMAKDLGVDLEHVPGSGPDGIITRADVLDFVEGTSGGNGRQPEPEGVLVTDDEGHPLPSAPPNVEPERVAIPAAPQGTLEQERVKLGQMRKTIATQMSRSRREIPEAVTWVEADATPLWDFRSELNAAQDDVKVSALAIIMRMVVAGLRKFPTVNASIDTTTDEMVLHRHVNLGFAAQTDRGLVVPVIPNAHEKNIIELATSLNELAQTARAGKLTPAQMSGGTFTISNYGAFGVDGGDMVINHPEAAILGTGRITDKPWVVDGELAVRKTILYSIAFDHRIIDGGEGAGFIRHLADLTENPTLLTAAL